jgi:small nuclear ribonucleoprotein D3
MSIGVPIKLLHEAESHVVSVELKNGEVYRGALGSCEDNMNCTLTCEHGADLTYTDRSGKVSHLEHVFIRGSQIRYFILPDMLKNAPFFRQHERTGRGLGYFRESDHPRGGQGGRGGGRGRR